MSDRFVINAAAYLILKKDNKILLAKRYNTGYMDGFYSLPAGHLDGNETYRASLVRETKEEIGITIKEDDLTFTHIGHQNSDKEYVDIFFECTNWEGVPEIMEPDKCDELRWVDPRELPNNVIPYVKNVLENYMKDVKYSEFGWC